MQMSLETYAFIYGRRPRTCKMSLERCDFITEGYERDKVNGFLSVKIAVVKIRWQLVGLRYLYFNGRTCAKVRQMFLVCIGELAPICGLC